MKNKGIKFKEKSKNEMFVELPKVDCNHCSKTLNGKHKWTEHVLIWEKPFLLFFKIRGIRETSQVCFACGIFK